jgi:hypothetical protein
MPKCTICDAEAEFCVKGASTYYCESCAAEQFGDVTYLVKVEGEAKQLKKAVDDALGDVDIEINEKKE